MTEAVNVSEGPAIGIDLGTTFSCVAVVWNGKTEVIANEQGNFTTPSFVAFTEHERLIGDTAKQQIAANAANTIFDVKRLIGRKFDDPIVQSDMQQWPFKTVNVNGMPKIQITYKGEVKRFSAEEISAMVLGKMKEVAESYLNVTVKNAVITVPAYFNDMQRKATRDAGTIAGLNVLRIINEPTAAAIAYGLNNDTKIAKNILVYDLGGGTFDVSILNIREDVYEVKATAGDTHLGGEDFDNLLMTSFAAEFSLKNNVNISGNHKALHKLRIACERAKRSLSTVKHTSIEIDSLADGMDFVTNITRAQFDDMCADLFGMTIKIVKSALKDAGMTCNDIDKVVLVGGSTRIPKIKQLLRDFFEGKEIQKLISPDEAVALGAAVEASIIHGHANAEMEKMKLLEVTPLTLGVQKLSDGVLYMSTIIERNTPIPTVKSKIYKTTTDNQTDIVINILQGEREFAFDNFKIGSLKIVGLPAAPAGAERLIETFSIDENGILNVSVISKSNRNLRNEISIENVVGSFTETEIKKMIADAKMYREQDKEMRVYHTTRWELEQYCYEMKAKHRNENKSVYRKCNEILCWLKTCCRPQLIQFHQRRDELKRLTLAPKDAKAEMKNIPEKANAVGRSFENECDTDDDIEMVYLIDD